MSTPTIGNLLGEVTTEDRAAAIRRLRYLMPASDLRRVLHAADKMRSLEEIIVGAEGTNAQHRQLPDSTLAEVIVDVLGHDLLALRDLRHRLAMSCSATAFSNLASFGPGVVGRGRRSRAKVIADRKWHPGKQWATHFTRALRFPIVFAGNPGESKPPAVEEIEPNAGLPSLEDFQLQIHSELLVVLNGNAGANRAIVTLPTGAGKTRTVVESLFDWRLTKKGSRTILWIAQSAELCEQAVQAFKEVWVDRGYNGERQPLRIGRLWEGRDVPIGECGIIVASIQQLHYWWRDNREQLAALREVLAVAVVDEAHRAVSPNHRQVLAEVGVRMSQRSAIPLIGLTATPRRLDERGTAQLRRSFHARIIQPSNLGKDPRQELRRRGVLSEVKARFIDYDGDPIDLEDNPRFLEHFDDWEDFHPKLLSELAADPDRNRRLVEDLLALPESCRVLIFACTVEHAQALAVLLRRRGRRAACVTASTRSSTRRALIEQFRQDRLSVLCNFGVLTTGFDAPQVGAVVVARPTASPILYEQMIGRGMRGPLFGGTRKCLVLDVKDNIRHHGTSVVVDYQSLQRMG